MGKVSGDATDKVGEATGLKKPKKQQQQQQKAQKKQLQQRRSPAPPVPAAPTVAPTVAPAAAPSAAPDPSPAVERIDGGGGEGGSGASGLAALRSIDWLATWKGELASRLAARQNTFGGRTTSANSGSNVAEDLPTALKAHAALQRVHCYAVRDAHTRVVSLWPASSADSGNSSGGVAAGAAAPPPLLLAVANDTAGEPAPSDSIARVVTSAPLGPALAQQVRDIRRDQSPADEPSAPCLGDIYLGSSRPGARLSPAPALLTHRPTPPLARAQYPRRTAVRVRGRHLHR